MNKAIFVLIFLTIFSLTVFAQDTAPLGFLLLGSGGRAYSTAESLTAVSSDLEALNYNPAGAMDLSYISFNFSHMNLFNTFKYEYFSFCYPLNSRSLKKEHVFGNLKYFHYDDFDWNIEGPDGKPEKYGLLSGNDFSLAIGYNKIILEHFGAGIRAKYIRSKLYDRILIAGAVDMGAIYSFQAYPLNLGISVRNIGLSAGYSSESEKEPLPADANLGALYELFENKKSGFNLNLLGNISYIFNAQEAGMSAGIESLLFKILYIGAGYKLFSDSTALHTGIGINLPDLRFNYSFIPSNTINDTHVFSLSIDFKNKEQTKDKETGIIKPVIPGLIINPKAGKYKEPVIITITAVNMKNGRIYYTTDRTDPDIFKSDFFYYSGKPLKIRIKSSKQLKLLALSDEGEQSQIYKASYIISK